VNQFVIVFVIVYLTLKTTFIRLEKKHRNVTTDGADGQTDRQTDRRIRMSSLLECIALHRAAKKILEYFRVESMTATIVR